MSLLPTVCSCHITRFLGVESHICCVSELPKCNFFFASAEFLRQSKYPWKTVSLFVIYLNFMGEWKNEPWNTVDYSHWFKTLQLGCGKSLIKWNHIGTKRKYHSVLVYCFRLLDATVRTADKRVTTRVVKIDTLSLFWLVYAEVLADFPPIMAPTASLSLSVITSLKPSTSGIFNTSLKKPKRGVKMTHAVFQ